ncbi:MAG: GTP-binding protein [Acidobacteriota bacterium]
MKAVKFVVGGPVGAGKTQFIRTLVGEGFVGSDVPTKESIGKDWTTVALDFGALELPPFQLHVFGLPGQRRFTYMWDVLLTQAAGLIFLLPADRPEHFSDGRWSLDYLLSRHSVPYIVGITRTDIVPSWAVEDVADYLQLPRERVSPVDPRKKDEALKLLESMMGK